MLGMGSRLEGFLGSQVAKQIVGALARPEQADVADGCRQQTAKDLTVVEVVVGQTRAVDANF